tara:strand:+ start:3972 stop:4727 length:756 start_codon:yes stop_codon:yes gene_type:complete
LSKKIATTFAGASYSLKMSQMRLEGQIKQSNHFDGIASFDENHPAIINFMRTYPDVFKYRRGFGYWAWKPFIIKTVMGAVDEGDYVLYLDAGNDIIGDPSELFNLCSQNNGFLLFENRSGNPKGDIWLNRQWTKMDCFNLMNCNTDAFINGEQTDGAYQLYQKNSSTIEFIDEYLKLCTDVRVVSDEPNITGDNFPDFIDHRHDQSVLSLLALKYGIKRFPTPADNPTNAPNPYNYGQIFGHHRGTIYGRR